MENKFAAEVSLAVRDAGIDASWTTGDANTWNKDQTELTMPLIAGNKFQLSTRSISGVKVAMDFKGGPSWLRHNGETFLRAGSVPNALIFTLNEDHLVGAGPVDVTITNNYQGDPYKFKVIPVAQVPAFRPRSRRRYRVAPATRGRSARKHWRCINTAPPLPTR